jgi:energy-coupling factor transport system ATP-binding protein
MSDNIIEFKDVRYRYPRTKMNVLKRINLSVKKGEFVVIMGENGAGKTTLCKCINGIIPHSERGRLRGEVLVEGHDTTEIATADLAQKVGIVLEDPETQLFTTSVANEIAFGAENLNTPVDEIMERIAWALKVVRLEGFDDRPPTALSGGQKQRLAIATALAMKPEVMVLDEPTSQLDPLGTEEVFEVIQKLKEEYEMTIIMVSHKVEEIIRFADKVCVLHEGSILAYDIPGVIFKDKKLFEDVQINTPYTFKLANYLKEHGVSMNDCITVDESVEEIKRIVCEGGK